MMRKRGSSSVPVWLAGFILTLTLGGCGGGGGGASPTDDTGETQPPVTEAFAVGAVTQGDALPGAVVVLRAAADSTHEVEAYAWEQTGGPPVTLASTSGESTRFRVPPLGDNTEFSFRVRARGAHGEEVSHDIHVLARPHRWKELHVVESDVRNDFVVFRADKDLDKRVELYRADLDGSNIVLLNDRLVPAGNVYQFQVSPDGEYVAYYADQDVDEVFELYVAASDGSGSNKVSGPLVAGGNVTDEFSWSPDSSRIAYRADQRTDEVFELFTSEPDGGDNQRASGDMAPGGNVLSGGFVWSPDSWYLAYRADQLADGRFELFTTGADGSENTRVSGLLTAGGGVLGNFDWAPDGDQLAYIADQRELDLFELFVVDPDGDNNTAVSGSLIDDGGVGDFAWSPDSSAIAYRAEQLTSDLVELFSVLRDGSGNTLLSSLPTTGAISAYAWAPDGSGVAYIADQRTDEQFELFVSGPAGGSNTRVSGTLIADGDVWEFAWSPASDYLAYRADQNADGINELFTSTPDGAANTQVSGPLVPGGDVFGDWQWSTDGRWLAYRADQLTDETIELFTATPDGSSNPLVSGAMVSGGDVVALSGQPFAFSPDSAYVVYSADQLQNQRFELYVTAPDGSATNVNVSGQLTAGGDVFDFAMSDARVGAPARPRVLVVAAENAQAWRDDVRDKLEATGAFATVGIFVASTGTPTLAQLQSYDAVLVFSNSTFSNRDAMGNVLADYIDVGGGVVSATFTVNTVPVLGRFRDDAYYALVPDTTTAGTRQTLDPVLPSHPLLTGVTSFDGGSSSYRHAGNAVVPGATVVARWTDGRPLIVTREVNGVRRVDLGFFPPSSDARSDLWDSSTDGDVIMVNALLYVTNRL